MSALLRLSICLWMVLACMACAHIVDPGGGPRDEQPPIVLSVFPRPNSTNVHPREVVITFDEYLKVGPIADQVFISPLPSVRPEIVVQGKQLRITFREPLLSNTTYSITVATGIRDFTEGNTLSQPFQMAFSTGADIDSGSCMGTVSDTVTQTALPGWNVGLFKLTHGDTIPAYLGQKPVYLTRSDATGSFQLSNIHPGTYVLLAFKDKDQNMAPDSLEGLAFSDSMCMISIPMGASCILNSVPTALRMEFRVKAQYLFERIVKLEFGRPILFTDTTLIVFPADSSGAITGDPFPVSTIPGGKTALVYLGEGVHTHLYMPTVLDSFGLVHSVHTEIQPTPILKTLRPALTLVRYLPETAELVFTHPVDPSYASEHGYIAVGNRLHFPAGTKDTLEIRIPSNIRFLQCEDSLASDTILRIPLRMFPNTGSAHIQLDKKPIPEVAFWLQAGDGTIVPGKVEGMMLHFNKVLPGKYSLYILEDLDYNGTRTLPNLADLPFSKPERMYRVPQTVEIRPNWDLEGIKVSMPW